MVFSAVVMAAPFAMAQVEKPVPPQQPATSADTPAATQPVVAPPTLAQLAAAPLKEARQMIGRGDYAAADQALRAILVTAPEVADAHFLLGFALLHEQKTTESLAEYTLGAKYRTPGAEELIGVASDYIVLKDFTDAEHWLQAAAKLAPERPIIWYLLGRTQYNENHWADAERSFLTCLRLDPHHLRAEYNLGLVYEAQQRQESALTAYRTAISWQETAATKDVQPYLDLGMLLRKQGKVADALPFLVTAAGNGSGNPLAGSRNPLAHQELGLAYEQLGKYDEAIGELKTAISISPKVEALHFFLGRLYRRTGHKDEAAQEFATAAKLSGTQSDASVPNADLQ